MAETDSYGLSYAHYTVGWVCALPLELAAGMIVLDEVHHSLPTLVGDSNSYTLGRICHHNVVMACLPINQFGLINAAAATTNMKRSFPSIRMCLVVGIGGGVPSRADVRLGDVVVGTKVVQHDRGKANAGGHIQRTETSRTLSTAVGSAVSQFQAQYDGSQFSSTLQAKLANHLLYRRPDSEDRLFQAEYNHLHPTADCGQCDSSKLVERGPRNSDTVIHYGGIASGSVVVKCGATRDHIAKELEVLCFEMEAAGVVDVLNCITIRGICDYSDSHKSKEWQNHAAAVAAVYAKEFLKVIPVAGSDLTYPANWSRPAHHISRERQKGVLNSLKFKRMSFRKHAIHSNHAKTCQWFLNNSSYQAWLDPRPLEHQGFLWISGKPGAGKSTLMKFVYSQVERKYRQSCQNGAMLIGSFFFNARGETLEKSAWGMYRSLLVQLLERFVDLQTILDDGELEQVLSQHSYPLGVLKDLFHNAVSALGKRAFIGFIDALDECDELELADIVRYFEQLVDYAVQQGIELRICFSSRLYPYINLRRGLQLRLEKQPGHDQDIAAYVKSELQINNPCSSKNLVDQILKKSEGVFLWVVLVVDMLNKEEREGRPDIESRLAELPGELSELFENIIRRDNKNVNDLQLSLLWILLAQRPLELEEFYHGCWYFKNPKFVQDYTSERGEKYVLSSTKGLAQAVQSAPPTVQFIHESVRDFLLKDDRVRKLWPDLAFNWRSLGHEQLKTYCCTYVQQAINFASFENHWPDTGISAMLPFLRYATQHVLYHAEHAAESTPQDGFLESFPSAQWVLLENKYQQFDIRKFTPEADLLYILAEKGFPNLIRTRLRKHPTIHIRGERRKYPLFAALACGNRGAVAALFNLTSTIYDGVDITEGLNYVKDLGSYLTCTPLSWAAKEGRAGLVKLLILSRADVNEYDKGRETPLIRAVLGGHATVAMILINAGADIERVDDGSHRGINGLTPLRIAAARGDVELTRLLIENGAKVHDSITGPETALFLASKHGHEAVARLLIEKGALDCRDRGKGSLVAAAENGNTDVARLLIDSGVSLNSKEGGSALAKASENGHEATVTLLISKRADINNTYNGGRTPLGNASGSGNEAVVRLLISKGADIHYMDTQGCTPLIRALEYGNEVVVRLLLSYGADIHHADSQGRTPLIYASASENEAVVELLISKGADIHHADSQGCTPLIYASASENEAVVELLISKGADIHRADSKGCTPLIRASGYSNEAVVRLLLSNGADIHRADSKGYTPLIHASQYSNKAVVRLLLSKGADIHRADSEGCTPLIRASEYGKEVVVRLLLSKGADIHHADSKGRTPLSHATSRGYIGIARLLLGYGADMNHVDSHGRTPREYSLRRRELTKLFDAQGAEGGEMEVDEMEVDEMEVDEMS